jgi:glucose-1-phosphate adenylyltransferase
MQDVLTLILGGGRGAGLYPLTQRRSEPAVPIAGKYRLIDIPISNCLNSGLNRIFVLTQFLSVSLHRHIALTYKFDPFAHGFVEILAAQQTNETAEWYEGTADAVRQNLRYIQDNPCREILILSGDQLYRMDFGLMLRAHRDSRADVTMAVVPVRRERTSQLGIVAVDDDNRVSLLAEKPQSEEELVPLQTTDAWFERRGMTGRDRGYLANMGIYLFNRQVLFDLVGGQPPVKDLVRELFPPHLHTHRIQAYLFDGYWDDLGTIKSYYEANLALVREPPPFDFHSPEGVIYTRMRHLPASRVHGVDLEQSLVSDGCTVKPGTRVERCIVGVRSQIGRDVTLRDSVIIGADRFETAEERAANCKRGVPDFTVGDGSLIERAILDKDCRIGRKVQIVNRRRVQKEDGANYVIRDGIVVIPNGAVVPDGTVI